MISPTERLHELGGAATRGTLLRVCDRAGLDRAVAAGDIVRVGWGRYVLAGLDEHAQTAARLGGAVCLTSAALHRGWAVKVVPDRPHLMFSRGRRLDPRDRSAHTHRGDLGPGDVLDGVTTEETTLAHCLRRLPLDEALCIADSALRAGVARSTLQRIAAEAAGPGAAQMRRVAAVASRRKANPFESTLHAIALGVPGLRVEPQVAIVEPGLYARPDLVDIRLRIVLEADSFEWHGGRAQLSADARRYDLLVVHGWTVLRFSYEHVMTQPEFVREMLLAAVELASGMRHRRPPGPLAA